MLVPNLFIRRIACKVLCKNILNNYITSRWSHPQNEKKSPFKSYKSQCDSFGILILISLLCRRFARTTRWSQSWLIDTEVIWSLEEFPWGVLGWLLAPLAITNNRRLRPQKMMRRSDPSKSSQHNRVCQRANALLLSPTPGAHPHDFLPFLPVSRFHRIDACKDSRAWDFSLESCLCVNDVVAAKQCDYFLTKLHYRFSELESHNAR